MSKPLTIDELKVLQVGDWVWIRELNTYVKIKEIGQDNVEVYVSQFSIEFMYIHTFMISTYGTKWLAFKNKEQAEAKGEIVELPCKVGDTMYWVYSCDQKEPISFIAENVSGKILDDGRWRFFAFNRYGYGGACGVIDGRWYLGKDKSEAECRLAELRGE